MTPTHRRPPLPETMSQRIPLGTCRWCGLPILPGQRKNPERCTWHLECLEIYYVISDPAHARRETLARSGGVCAICGGVATEHDHIMPLIDALPLADNPLWPWLLGNLQSLCPDCHRAKTKRENSQRAKWRRRWRRWQVLRFS